MNLRTLLFVAAFQGLATRVDLVFPQYSGRVSQSSFNFFRPHILCSIVSCLTVHCTLWSGRLGNLLLLDTRPATLHPA